MELHSDLFIQKERFKTKYDKHAEEVYILTENESGATRLGDDVLWTVNMSILAYVDIETGELFKGKKTMSWLSSEEERLLEDYGLNLKPQTIYRVKIRKSLPYVNKYSETLFEYGEYFMLDEVLERDCHHLELEEILKEYQKEVIIRPDGCHDLLLDKALGLFSGSMIWNGKECSLHLDADDDEAITADEAIDTLQKLLNHSQEWEEKIRLYAAEYLTDIANDWSEDIKVELSVEEFNKRMRLDNISVMTEGDFEFFFNDDGMIGGHDIVVSGNIDKGLDDANIIG